MDLIEDLPGIGTFRDLLGRVGGLEWELRKGSGYTLFIPTDAAFEKIVPTGLALLRDPGNRSLLRRRLLYHIVDRRKFASLQSGGGYIGWFLGNLTGPKLAEREMKVRSREGSYIAVDGRVGRILLNYDAVVVHRDLKAYNARIHLIDTVLVTPNARGFHLLTYLERSCDVG